jgi:hypothetical protein
LAYYSIFARRWYSTKKDPNSKPKYAFSHYSLNEVCRPHAPFVQPMTHTTIHLLSTRFKGPKCDSETGVIHHFNMFVNTRASKHDQFLFNGPSMGRWEMPSNLNRFRFDEIKIYEVYNEWSSYNYSFIVNKIQ